MYPLLLLFCRLAPSPGRRGCPAWKSDLILHEDAIRGPAGVGVWMVVGAKGAGRGRGLGGEERRRGC